jgi:hypothetical protein
MKSQFEPSVNSLVAKALMFASSSAPTEWFLTKRKSYERDRKTALCVIPRVQNALKDTIYIRINRAKLSHAPAQLLPTQSELEPIVPNYARPVSAPKRLTACSVHLERCAPILNQDPLNDSETKIRRF